MITANVLSGVEAVVFDLDDTLILERDFVCSGFEAVGREVWRELGIPHFGSECRRLFELGRRSEIFDEVLLASGISAEAELIEHLVDVYRSHRPRLGLLPDAARLLRRCKGKQIPVAILSDGHGASQRNKIEAAGIERYAALIALTDELGGSFSKPSRQAFTMVQQQLGIEHQRMAYIGDNPRKDFQAPRSLGWRTVRVCRPGGIYSELDSVEVDAEVESLDGLVEAESPTGTGWPARRAAS